MIISYMECFGIDFGILESCLDCKLKTSCNNKLISNNARKQNKTPEQRRRYNQRYIAKKKAQQLTKQEKLILSAKHIKSTEAKKC